MLSEVLGNPLRGEVMRIDLDRYRLSESEYSEISKMMASLNGSLDLESLWGLMDQVWFEVGCASRPFRQESLEEFYKHPVWALNGIFIEHDPDSMDHRRAFAKALSAFKPQQVLEVGGGFGTLARLMSQESPDAQISLFEPYPSQCMLSLCGQNPQIKFVAEFESDAYDMLVCTDVLEHVLKPLDLLVTMIAAVQVGGYLLIANCFEPVIACHLPSTFHLRYSFDDFCSRLGLRKLDSIDLPYGAIYQKIDSISLQKDVLHRLEIRSQRLYPLKAWSERWLAPWAARFSKARQEPMHYLRQLAERLRQW